MAFNFKPQENPNTKEIEQVATCSGELVSISDAPKENVNKTLFRNASVKVITDDGSTKTFGAIMYESNFLKGVKVGESYLTTITQNASGSILLTVSHLTNAGSASASDFGLAPIVSKADLDKVS